MNEIDQLYFLLGYLEGLSSEKEVLPSQMDKVKMIIHQNSFFREKIMKDTSEEFDDDCIENEHHRNWTEEDYEEEGWSFDDMNPAHDPSQNPWINVSGPGEEAEMAYWNHD